MMSGQNLEQIRLNRKILKIMVYVGEREITGLLM